MEQYKIIGLDEMDFQIFKNLLLYENGEIKILLIWLSTNFQWGMLYCVYSKLVKHRKPYSITYYLFIKISITHQNLGFENLVKTSFTL